MAIRSPGSFHDPSGYVFTSGDRIFRAVNDEAYNNFLLLKASGACADLRSKEWIIAAEETNRDHAAHDGRWILEHPKLPFISYPYEWPFSLLKRAALLHQDVHLRALDFDFTISDASAYNVQFCGVKAGVHRYPVVHTLSGGRLLDGPAAVRGPIRQSAVVALAIRHLAQRLVSRLDRWPANERHRPPARPLQTMVHADPADKHYATGPVAKESPAQHRLAAGETAAASQDCAALHIATAAWLDFKAAAETIGPSEWHRYGIRNDSYVEEEEERKRDFIAQFSQSLAPACAWDMGCNTGKYSEVLLQNKTKSIVGFDFDFGALEAAISRAAIKHLHFLPLFSDAANPSPQQGWAETERLGLRSRSGADAIIALAIVHHLAIGRNIPLPAVIEWLVGLAPHGVIEFVPKFDRALLATGVMAFMFFSYHELVVATLRLRRLPRGCCGLRQRQQMRVEDAERGERNTRERQPS